LFTFGGKLKRSRSHPNALSRLENSPWREREALTAEEEQDGFRPAMVEGLPAPARRWFLHAVRPGNQLATHVHLAISGEIRMESDGDWLPLKAEETLAPPFRLEWQAVIRRGWLVLRAEERYAVGAGRRSASWFGFINKEVESGPEFSRSLLERAVMESIWVPTALLPKRGVIWSAPDDAHAVARLTINQVQVSITLTVGPDGRLREVMMQRHGNVGQGRYEERPFGIRVDEEIPFSGYTIPAVTAAGWFYGTDRFEESLRYRIDSAEFAD
jgi:hypothetical protein